MGRKGMKGFMKTASKASGPNTDDGADPEPQQPEAAAAVSSSKSTQKQSAPQAAAPAASKAAESSSAAAFELEDPDAGPETRGQMLQRHKREVLAHKKAVQKLGKSKKDEAAKLSQRIEERHERELKELGVREAAEAAAASPSGAAAAAAKQDALAASASKYVKNLAVDEEDGADEGGEGQQKRTKAQKRKEKQAARDAEREARIAAEKEELGPSEREEEETALKALLAPLGLAIKEIRADGHCMYRSLEDQLQQQQQAQQQEDDADEDEEEQQQHDSAKHSYQQLREAAAAYMRAHRDEFEPYMEDPDDGEAGDAGDDDDPDARFERYCATVEGTAAWGGHLELKALAGALQRRIQVLAVGMDGLALGEEFADKGTLQVCYLRHAYGLGEHYNSVKPSVLAGVGHSEDHSDEHDEQSEHAEPAL